METRRRSSVVLERGRTSRASGLGLTRLRSTGFSAGVPRCPPRGAPRVLGPEKQLQGQEEAVPGRGQQERAQQTGLGRAGPRQEHSCSSAAVRTGAIRTPTTRRERATCAPVTSDHLPAGS